MPGRFDAVQDQGTDVRDSETERLVQQCKFVRQAIVKHARIVGVHRQHQTGIPKLPHRMIFDPGNGARGHVRERTKFDRHGPFRQQRHDLPIPDGGEAVANAVHAQRLHRAAYALGPRRLTGMGRCAQALISGGLIHRCEGFGRVQMFGTADADADDAAIHHLCHLGQGIAGPFRAVIAHQVGDQPDLYRRHLVQSLSDRLGQTLRFQALVEKPCRGKKHLRIADILRRQIPGHGLGNVGEILVGTDKAVLPDPGGNEVWKILVVQPLAQIVQAGNIRITAVLLDQPVQGRQGNGPLQMQVQFHFWQGINPAP